MTETYDIKVSLLYDKNLTLFTDKATADKLMEQSGTWVIRVSDLPSKGFAVTSEIDKRTFGTLYTCPDIQDSSQITQAMIDSYMSDACIHERLKQVLNQLTDIDYAWGILEDGLQIEDNEITVFYTV